MDYKKYVINFTNLEHFLEIHAIIWKSLEFPDYYGCNWDAFWDCLTDMYGDPIHIEIIGLEVLKSKFDDSAEKMIKILKQFKHYANNTFSDTIKIEIIHKDGTCEEID